MDTLSQSEALNARFGIAGVAQVVAGKGGLPMVRVSTAAATAEISLYGAQVTKWRPAGAKEVLFLSEKAYWDTGRAIRGGIPVCFPWFGDKADDANAPKHGFVRTKQWRLDSLSALDDGSVTLVCITEGDAATRPIWPHDFCVAYRITVGLKLRLELTVINSGKAAMRFEEALHSYLRVGKVSDVTVRGLDGIAYLDKNEAFQQKMQVGDVSFTGPIDRMKRMVRTEKVNSTTTVVWNPWEEQAAIMSDFGNDEWEKMVCIEGSNVQAAAIALNPGEEHTLRVTLSAVPG
jgi:glucose-6-phosphate 1-epimerase